MSAKPQEYATIRIPLVDRWVSRIGTTAVLGLLAFLANGGKLPSKGEAEPSVEAVQLASEPVLARMNDVEKSVEVLQVQVADIKDGFKAQSEAISDMRKDQERILLSVRSRTPP